MSNKTRRASQESTFPRIRYRSAGFVLTSFSVATVVATGIFWIMYQLVSVAEVVLPPEPTPPGLRFIRLNEKPPAPPPKRIKPVRPKTVDMPLPASLGSWKGGNGVPSFSFSQSNTFEPLKPLQKGSIGIGERDYMPLTEIQPHYPERLITRGIEGTCVVTYTVTRTGSVTDVQVDKNRCSHVLFEGASIKAASKFKYAPRIVDGQTVDARNVSKLFRFSITD